MSRDSRPNKPDLEREPDEWVLRPFGERNLVEVEQLRRAGLAVDHDVHRVQVDVVELRLVAERHEFGRSCMKRGEMKSA